MDTMDTKLLFRFVKKAFVSFVSIVVM